MTTDKLPPIGLQPIVLGHRYTLADARVLDHLAACGYRFLETNPAEPLAFRQAAQQRGLQVIGLHLTPAKLLDMHSIIEQMRILGATDICNSGLWNWNARSLEDWKLLVAILNRAGKILRSEGMYLHYHNHDFEFQMQVQGLPAMEWLADQLDPAACDFCIDVGWVKKAGADPLSFLLRHRERIGYLHLKDCDDQGWTELGCGKLDIGSILQAACTLPHLRWMVCEQDQTRLDPLESLRLTREYLRDSFGI